MAIVSRNPATGEVLREFGELDGRAIDRALETADAAFRRYREMPIERRAALMRDAATILETGKERWAELMTLEMGKLNGAALTEVEKCSWVCRYYADHAAEFLADESVASEARQSFVRFLPLGVVLAVMPWNFPFWQVFRFAVPTLMAGNAALLKHASNVPQCALAVEEVFRLAGLPDGVFQTLLIGSDKVAALIEDRRVAAVTLTGSVEAGAKVAEQAGRQVKKTVLELGGSDPFIVLPSTDLDSTVDAAVAARTINNGQSCIAAKRFIVHEAIYDAFESRFAEKLTDLKVGDPMDEATDVGPLAMESARARLAQQVEESVAAGARLLCGGESIAGPGYFYAPGALADIPPDAAAYREEVFGPVALLFRARDLDHAIRLANDSRFGLGSSVWTRDTDEQQHCIDGLAAGQTFINALVASDPRLPFGGVKRSGYGRELGRFGIREFVNVKTIYIA